MIHTIILIIALIVAAWMVVSWYIESDAIATPYTVIQTKHLYEIRRYEPSIIAWVELPEHDDRQAFKILAAYIFGNNKAKKTIGMTTPVVQKRSSATINMTTPVITLLTQNTVRMCFIMPSTYTMDTLPLPNNPMVRLQEVPSTVQAVYSFGWYPTASRVKKAKAILLQELKKEGIAHGIPVLARFNPPFAFPFFMRNEIWVEIQASDAQLFSK